MHTRCIPSPQYNHIHRSHCPNPFTEGSHAARQSIAFFCCDFIVFHYARLKFVRVESVTTGDLIPPHCFLVWRHNCKKRALETVKVQTPGRIISRVRLHSLLNPNARSQTRYNDCTDNHRINSVYQTQHSATSLEVKNVMKTRAKDRPQRANDLPMPTAFLM